MLIRPITYEFKIDGKEYECIVDSLRWSPNKKIPEYKLKASVHEKVGRIYSPVNLKETKRMTWNEVITRIIEIIKTGI